MLESNKIVVPKQDLVYRGEMHDGHNDHRIVMALAVLATRTGGIIDGAQAAAKSMPDFFERLQNLGFEVTTYDA